LNINTNLPVYPGAQGDFMMKGMQGGMQNLIKQVVVVFLMGVHTGQVNASTTSRTCKDLAMTAALQLYSTRQNYSQVLSVSTRRNPKAQTNGYSTYVDIRAADGTHSYIVMGAPSAPGPVNKDCRKIDYVIEASLEKYMSFQ
jgi:hypothetical protein